MIKVNGTNSAAGLRAYANAIRPTADDYAAAAIVGRLADVEARNEAARRLDAASRIAGKHQRASYLRSHGFQVTA